MAGTRLRRTRQIHSHLTIGSGARRTDDSRAAPESPWPPTVPPAAAAVRIAFPSPCSILCRKHSLPEMVSTYLHHRLLGLTYPALYDPLPPQAFPDNRIPASRLDRAAQ